MPQLCTDTHESYRTIALGPNGTIKLAGPSTFDVSKCQTDKSLEDEDLKALIAKPLKAAKTKKKKQAATDAAQPTNAT